MKRIYQQILGSTAGLAILATSHTALSLTREECINRVNDTPEKLTECITQDGLMDHLIELQDIADNNGGSRGAGTSGYADSVAYIHDQMVAAGYLVTVQDFEFQYWNETSPPIFEQVSPDSEVYEEGPDYVTAQFAGTADITAKVQAVGEIIDGEPPVRPTASGCSIDDYADFVPGNIALAMRGGCDNRDKARNAVAAGAVGLLTFNWDDTNVPNTLQELFDIPVFAYFKYSIGIDLYRKSLTPEGVTVRMKTATEDAVLQTQNVIADSQFGKPNSIVMSGAHLDTVYNAGINDNGTGSAGILEMAIMLQHVQTPNRMRFAWWGAEEAGLVGSYHYVENLSPAERNQIELYLNYDMIGSPNHMVAIYGVDHTDPYIPRKVKRQMDAVTHLYEQHFDALGQPYLPQTDEEGVSILAGARSDHGGFIDYLIPVGGLFTGAEERKKEEEVPIFGGVADEPYDACYHLLCDTLDNVDIVVHEAMTRAGANVLLQYGFDKKLNAKDGKINVDYTQPKGRRIGHHVE